VVALLAVVAVEAPVVADWEVGMGVQKVAVVAPAASAAWEAAVMVEVAMGVEKVQGPARGPPLVR
jgi:hypothetical protein